MNQNKYNGWSSYETWLVKLWMDNDEGSQSYWSEVAGEHFKVDGDDAVRSLAERLKEEHRDYAEQKIGCNCWLSDLVGAALYEVDWEEIAESLLHSEKTAK